jgi:hypothetical protein
MQTNCSPRESDSRSRSSTARDLSGTDRRPTILFNESLIHEIFFIAFGERDRVAFDYFDSEYRA